MNVECGLFLALSSLTLISALAVVLLRHVVYGALFLGLCLALVGGLYALMGADFLFAAQILIYVTAIAVLFLFAILLAGRRAELVDRPFNVTAIPGVLTAVGALALLTGTFWQVKESWQAVTRYFTPSTAAIGDMLLGPYAVGVEIMGVILLVALIGATILTRAGTLK